MLLVLPLVEADVTTNFRVINPCCLYCHLLTVGVTLYNNLSGYQPLLLVLPLVEADVTTNFRVINPCCLYCHLLAVGVTTNIQVINSCYLYCHLLMLVLQQTFGLSTLVLLFVLPLVDSWGYNKHSGYQLLLLVLPLVDAGVTTNVRVINPCCLY